jgi:hypothetical protein
VETLSLEFARLFILRMGVALSKQIVSGVQVEITESPGQGGSYFWTWDEQSGGFSGD